MTQDGDGLRIAGEWYSFSLLDRIRLSLFEFLDGIGAQAQHVRDLREKFQQGKVRGTTWMSGDAACIAGWMGNIMHGANQDTLMDVMSQKFVSADGKRLYLGAYDNNDIFNFILPIGVKNREEKYAPTNELHERSYIVIDWLTQYLAEHYWRNEGLRVNDFRALMFGSGQEASVIQDCIDVAPDRNDIEGYLHTMAGYYLNMRTDEIETWVRLNNEKAVMG